VFEELFTFQLAMHRHRSAPLRVERETFLEELRRQGASRHLLLQTASRLIYIVHYLRIPNLRSVTTDEIRQAARVWVKNRDPDRLRTFSRSAIYGFTGLARKFLRFHGCLSEPPKRLQPFPHQLEKFMVFITKERGLRAETVKGYRWHVITFLNWLSQQSKRFSALTSNDIDYYLLYRSEKWKPLMLRTAANVLRIFFQYAKMQRWSPGVMPEAIKGPCIYGYHSLPAGPSWFDVLRLLRFERPDRPGSMRMQVLLLLFALYGLRTSEATGLLLNNLDWKNKSFTVRRSKNNILQQFPILPALESALTRYLKLGRPNCHSDYLLVTQRPPFRRLDSHSVSQDIHWRMRRLGIQSMRQGPISLRHACATRLLSKDMSLQEIADFLGHQDCLSVGIYAKHDIKGLKKVTKVDLCRGL
jgi:integrase/recombinase XerD